MESETAVSPHDFTLLGGEGLGGCAIYEAKQAPANTFGAPMKKIQYLMCGNTYPGGYF